MNYWNYLAMLGGGGGGSSSQPDWEQTDTTASDYIKNKPFELSVYNSITKTNMCKYSNYNGNSTISSYTLDSSTPFTVSFCEYNFPYAGYTDYCDVVLGTITNIYSSSNGEWAFVLHNGSTKTTYKVENPTASLPASYPGANAINDLSVSITNSDYSYCGLFDNYGGYYTCEIKRIRFEYSSMNNNYKVRAVLKLTYPTGSSVTDHRSNANWGVVAIGFGNFAENHGYYCADYPQFELNFNEYVEDSDYSGLYEYIVNKYQSNATTIKTALDATMTVNTVYALGEISTAALVLPTATAGDEIKVIFYSGTTATTMTITGAYLGTAPTPSTSQRIELDFLYDGTNWSLLSNTQAVSAS